MLGFQTPVKRYAREIAASVPRYARASAELPSRSAHHLGFAYGAVQPLVGLALLARDRRALRLALVPVAGLAVVCLSFGLFTPTHFLSTFYRSFALLAPLPSVLFAKRYARLAAHAHDRFELGPCHPRLEGLYRSCKKALKQFLLVSLLVSPLLLCTVGLLGLMPGGQKLLSVLGALWALHWIIVEAFDDARVLAPGETLADADAQAARAAPPWFVRVAGRLQRRPLGFIVRGLTRWGDRTSVEWREEIAIVEQHPAVAVGFGTATAALLAIPVLNLFFRPIIIVGAVHLLGQLAAAAPQLTESSLATAEPVST
jgi:hypothetical protein